MSARILITGAGAGIGAALAARYLADGHHVVALDRSVDQEQQRNAKLSVLQVDLAHRQELRLVPERLQEFGPFDIVVHNAGVSATGRFEAIPNAAYDALLGVNMDAPILLTPLLLQSNLMAPGARLVFVSSLSHAVGYPGASVYAASKDAVAIYARSIRKAVKSRGMSVTTVFPGPVKTAHAQRHAPLGANEDARMAPDEIARRIVKAVERRSNTLYPGVSAKLAALAGRILPQSTTKIMRRAIFEKLDRNVW